MKYIVVLVIFCNIVEYSVSTDKSDEFCEKGDIGDKSSALCSRSSKSELLNEGTIIKF